MGTLGKCKVCNGNARYNEENKIKGEYCKIHKTKSMRNVCQQYCIKCNIKVASFNLEGKTSEYCGDCKTSDMININKKTDMCISCKKIRAGYNYKDETKPKYCYKCKDKDMIDIINKKCKCGLHQPCFNYDGYRPEYCSICKLPGMEDVLNPICIICQDTKPTYNYSGETKRLYCEECKLDGMISIRYDLCKCGTRASYTISGKKPTHCKSCKTKDMINVVNNLCINCKLVNASFNIKGEKNPLYCSKCKTSDMEDIVHKKCIFCNKTIAIYNYKGLPPLFCFSCKLSDMENVLSPKCKNNGCNIISNKKYDGYCSECFFDIFPNEHRVKNYKVKQNNVTKFILKEFYKQEWICDKIIGPSKKRPDLITIFSSYAIMIEIDEYSHRFYDEEIDRINMIYNDIKKILIVIRFNPDTYHDLLENKIPSSWKNDNISRKCIINNQHDWENRLDVLKKEIYYWLHYKSIIKNEITIIYLFY